MKKVYFLLALLVIALCFTGVAQATVIDFEDLYPGYEGYNYPIPAGYAGFTWGSNTGWMTKNAIPGSGYDYGTIGKVSIYTAWEEDISMNDGYFDFNGAYITAAWNTGQDVTVEGWRDGSLLYTTTIITSYDGPYWFDFDYSGVDTLWFKPGDLGTNAGFSGSGHHLAIDNITYNEKYVPEPSTLLLLGSGLAGLLAGIRKRFKT